MGGVGVVPTGRTIVLDIDVSSESLSAPEQVGVLEEVLAIELGSALKVCTPSGGMHIYLSLPSGVAMPKNGKLSRIDDRLKGDVRGSAALGFVVLAGTLTTDGWYLFESGKEVQELRVESALALSSLVGVGRVKPKGTAKKDTTRVPAVLADQSLDELINKLLSSDVPPSTVSRVRDTLSDEVVDAEIPDGVVSRIRPYHIRTGVLAAASTAIAKVSSSTNKEAYHPRRAAVFGALKCSTDDAQIVAHWKRMELDRDSYTGKEIATSSLFAEVRRLRGKFGGSCSHLYCRGDDSRINYQGKASGGAGRINPIAEKLALQQLGSEDSLFADVKIESALNSEDSADNQIGSLNVDAGSDSVLASIVSESLKKLQAKKNWSSPHVLDFEKAVLTLRGKRKEESQFFSLAVRILEDFVNPWINFGAIHVLLSEKFLSENYCCSEEEIHQAKRLLLRRKILVNSVSQLPGRTSAFFVNPEFIDLKLSKLLTAVCLRDEVHYALDLRDAVIVNPFTGDVAVDRVARVAHYMRAGEKMSAVLPERTTNFSLYEHFLRQGTAVRKSFPINAKARIKRDELIAQREANKQTSVSAFLSSRSVAEQRKQRVNELAANGDFFAHQTINNEVFALSPEFSNESDYPDKIILESFDKTNKSFSGTANEYIVDESVSFSSRQVVVPAETLMEMHVRLEKEKLETVGKKMPSEEIVIDDGIPMITHEDYMIFWRESEESSYHEVQEVFNQDNARECEFSEDKFEETALTKPVETAQKQEATPPSLIGNPNSAISMLSLLNNYNDVPTNLSNYSGESLVSVEPSKDKYVTTKPLAKKKRESIYAPAPVRSRFDPAYSPNELWLNYLDPAPRGKVFSAEEILEREALAKQRFQEFLDDLDF